MAIVPENVLDPNDETEDADDEDMNENCIQPDVDRCGHATTRPNSQDTGRNTNDTAHVAHCSLIPSLKRVPSQCKARLRSHRVSVCIRNCRNSASVVERAIEKLQWEPVSRDTAEVSVAWLEHTDSTALASPFEAISKIEGMIQVCRKVDSALCLQAMRARYNNEYDFVPNTWVLSSEYPAQLSDLERTMNTQTGCFYICKPTAGSQGRGVHLVSSFHDLRGSIRDAFPFAPTSSGLQGNIAASVSEHSNVWTSEYVVQQYVSRPLLVDGFKFDCRCYLIVTSVVPLRAYLFEEGLARFATSRYEQPRNRNLGNACMHLTNYAVNRNNDGFSAEQAHDAGSKRSLSSVFDLIATTADAPSAAQLWDEIRSVAEKTLLALRPALVEHISRGDKGALHPAGPKGFQIIGIDVLFDEQYRPHLMEMNANASMSILQPVDAAQTADNCVIKNSPHQICELDDVVKTELVTQALLVVNPLPHGFALKERVNWLEREAPRFEALRMGTRWPVDEPITLDDNGRLAEHADVSGVPAARQDRPDRCPALRSLSFDRHLAYGHVRAHLLAYRIWRHYSFERQTPNIPRPYPSVGFEQFVGLCSAAGVMGKLRNRLECRIPNESRGHALWTDLDGVAEFFKNAVRGHVEGNIDVLDGSTVNAAYTVGGRQPCDVALDFHQFVEYLAEPLGVALLQLAPLPPQRPAMQPLEAFVMRILPTIPTYRTSTAEWPSLLTGDGDCSDLG